MCPRTVNLPTWIWQETADIGEVSATARLDDLGLEATTVATPSALTLRAGTGDATLHPGDGQCTINADGTIGEPYTDDRAEEEPPCGITYRRATADGEAYELSATITWSVSWTGTDNPEPQELPDAVLETTQDVTVQEVQTIVR
jgi:enoyl reductase